jgi:phosphoribosylaminoimidazole carboxylase (NCAIR synthetase)
VTSLSGDHAREEPNLLLARGVSVEEAHVHLSGKVPQPGRKLGNVTVCGADAERVGAHCSAARALGTPVPAGVELTRSVSVHGVRG